MRATSRPLTVVALLLGLFLAAMEMTVVSTAMPTVVGELGGLALYAWAFAAYMLTADGHRPDPREARRPPWPQARAPRGHRAVPRGLGACGFAAADGRPHRLARGAGARRGSDAAGRRSRSSATSSSSTSARGCRASSARCGASPASWARCSAAPSSTPSGGAGSSGSTFRSGSRAPPCSPSPTTSGRSDTTPARPRRRGAPLARGRGAPRGARSPRGGARRAARRRGRARRASSSSSGALREPLCRSISSRSG